MDVPNELWTEIIKYCDISSIFQLMVSCKRIYSCCQTEHIWYYQWQKLIGRYQLLLDTGPDAVLNYKDICQRYVQTFGLQEARSNSYSFSQGVDFSCCKCEGVLCTTKCLETSDELIIFDFGSKTTWFKYESENTGQLSMHPTVAPLTEILSDDITSTQLSGEERLLTDSCPVCSKIVKKRHSLLHQSGGSLLKDKKKITNAFTRLSFKGLQCFESSQLDSDETEYTAAVLTNPLIPQDDNTEHLPNGLLTLIPGESSTLGDCECTTGGITSSAYSVLTSINKKEDNVIDRLEDAVGSDNVSVLENRQQSHCEEGDHEESPIQNCNKIEDFKLDCLQKKQVQTLLFLMTHMLKRNAFLPGKNIPFVICEPQQFNKETKRDIIKHVFEDLKVPGMCFVSKPVAVSLYIGLDTCLVVDSGANNTVVTPVINQSCIKSAMQWKPIGGRHISVHLKECLRMKGIDFEVDEANLDSSQVKRECWLSYNPDVESKRKIPNKNITLKGQRIEESGHFQVTLSHELYLAVENMYLNLQLAEMIKKSVQQFDTMTQTKLLSNIVLSGGNCRLSGLANRLTRDLQEVMSEHSHCIRVCDPRLMTGRTDVVVGASYIKRLDSVHWISRQQYIFTGVNDIDEISC